MIITIKKYLRGTLSSSSSTLHQPSRISNVSNVDPVNLNKKMQLCTVLSSTVLVSVPFFFFVGKGFLYIWGLESFSSCLLHWVYFPSLVEFSLANISTMLQNLSSWPPISTLFKENIREAVKTTTNGWISFSLSNDWYEETLTRKWRTVSTYPCMIWIRIIDQISWYNVLYNPLQGCRVNKGWLSHMGTKCLPAPKLNKKEKHDNLNFEIEHLTHTSSEIRSHSNGLSIIYI